MSVTIKTEPRLVRANGSHSVEIERTGRTEFGPFSREEFYPILEMDVPRVGFVRASFEANRYVHSNGWSEWRIFLRDVRTPDPERPEIPHLGDHAAGIGDATRAAIRDACLPIIQAWIDSDEYRASRFSAVAKAITYQLEAPQDYTLARARQTMGEAFATGELDCLRAQRLGAVLDMLALAREMLDALDEDPA